MKMLKIVLFILGIIIVAGGLLAWFSSKPISRDKADEMIRDLIDSEVDKKDTLTQGLLLVDSKGYGFEGTYAAGELSGQSIETDQPFHVASVGKAFTATLIGLVGELYQHLMIWLFL